jgi:hypothetical protein
MTTDNTTRRLPRVGDRIRIERDETAYPSRGTWPGWRGRTGTVAVINRDRQRPLATEYGVVFGATRQRADRDGAVDYSESPAWFLGYELTVCP